MLATNVKVVVEGAPLWLSVLALALSFGAVAIAFWQGNLAARGQRNQRPNVSGTVGYHLNVVYSGSPGVPAFIVYLNNRGSQSTTVEGVIIGTESKVLNGQNSILDGPTIPFRLEGHSSQSWIVDAKLFAPDDEWVQARVSFGHGPSLSATVQRNKGSASLRSHRSEPDMVWNVGSGKDKARQRFRA